ncbi:uridylate kinase [Pyrolobus fumarii 1A]|uniref:UMP kinase n=1 Tax=Pyrolobus fumarii (strain DSM 11204 / 1A) TaxID=694429 RepID=G0EGV7_PYRF1|nr:UMP kinase [Pyrolobus fumarii]AEM39255.1 uridylate kinase [Pyrolobus fumarii 1A]
MSRPSIVVKISGKLVEDTGSLQGLVGVLRELINEYRVAIVVGGGRLARKYVSFLGSLQAPKSLMDIAGIEASRFYARVLALALGSTAPVPRSYEEFLTQLATGVNPIVAGGFQPGQSTTAVAALIAEAMRAERLVIATVVDGVFDRDPAKHPDAKLFPRLSITEALRVIESSTEPGRYELLEPYAASILQRSGTRVYIVNGRHPERVLEAARGGEPIGTLLTPD